MTGGRENISKQRESIINNITDIKLQIIENQKDVVSLNSAANDLENSISNLLYYILSLNNFCFNTFIKYYNNYAKT